MSPRKSAAEAEETRRAILDRAVDMASIEGLEGLTIGRLATEMQMSKAGVVGRFGSKEALQLAALHEAVSVFTEAVWEPVAGEPAGLPRLLALCEAWIGYLERDVFPGGCFFTAASCEFDGRPGPVRDAVAAMNDRWLRTIAADVRTAIDAGDLPATVDPDEVAFTLNALAMGANQARQLRQDPAMRERALAAMRRALGA